jgi:hypothetical protein
MEFKESTLQMLFDETEFEDLRQLTSNVSSRFSDIQGVLITGSLVQRLGLPTPPTTPLLTSMGKAYAEIVGRTRRKLFPHIDSDFDFWVLTKEQPGNEGLQDQISEQGLQLLAWYAEQEKVNLLEWVRRKKQAFDPIYKKPFLYSDAWNNANTSIPSNAEGFRYALEEAIQEMLPSLVEKIRYYFRRKIPGDFIEARAFPPSVFNLKTERIPVGNSEDRTPFPFYIRDWVDRDRNCIVLYVKDDPSQFIYPFNPNGFIPGENVARNIQWSPRHIDHVLYGEGIDKREE